MEHMQLSMWLRAFMVATVWETAFVRLGNSQTGIQFFVGDCVT